MKLPEDIILIAGMSDSTLYNLISKPHYREFNTIKKSGGYRKISAPNFELKKLQRRINRNLTKKYIVTMQKGIHGFIPKLPHTETLGIMSNARPHVGMKFVLNMDIKNFFHSISTLQIMDALMQKPFAYDAVSAEIMALICCYKRKLPMGAPTSPTLSNIYCIEMDAELINYCSTQLIQYTRYADDLTFSSNEPDFADSIPILRNLICKYGFEINEKKYRMQSHLGAQRVTGLKVNEIVNVERTYIRNIRAILFDVNKNGWERAALKHFSKHPRHTTVTDFTSLFQNIIAGKIEHIGHAKGKQNPIYMKLKEKYLLLFTQIMQ
jgi:RNA-directed DNA polymerase